MQYEPYYRYTWTGSEEALDSLRRKLFRVQGAGLRLVRDRTANKGTPRAYRYADIGQLLSELLPLLQQEELLLVQADVSPEQSDEHRRHIATQILDVSTGASLDVVTCWHRPVRGAMSETQKDGATLTYSRRKQLQALLGLADYDEDAAPRTLTPWQQFSADCWSEGWNPAAVRGAVLAQWSLDPMAFDGGRLKRLYDQLCAGLADDLLAEAEE